MRTFTTEKVRCFAAICFSFIMALSTHAQTGNAPQKMSYQAVVRDGTNSLLANKTVGMRISILQGSEAGSVVYRETHSAATNTNGLVSIAIGSGKVESGAMVLIDWSNGPFFVKTEIDPNGGTSYSIVSTTQLLTVPFALYAEKAGNGFDGNYENLINKPMLSDVATSGDYSDLNGKPVLADVAVSGDYKDLLDKPALAEVATSGSYAKLKDTPVFATVATTGSYKSLKDTLAFAKVAISGNYNDLLNAPKVPVKVSELENDSKYLVEEKQQLKLEGRNLSITDKNGKVVNMIVLPADTTKEGVTDYEQLINKPEGTNNGDLLYWNSSNKKWNTLGIGQEGQVLSVSNGKLSWTEPSYIVNTEAYEAGDIFTKGGTPEGIIVKSDKLTRSGLLLSLVEETPVHWGKFNEFVGAIDEYDGETNTTLIAELSQWNTNYPAFASGRKAGDSWYLPSAEELKLIAANMDKINQQLQAAGGTSLTEDYYWTSTERDLKDAFGVTFKAVSITNPDASIRGEEEFMKTKTVKTHDGKRDSLIFESFDIPKGERVMARKDTELKIRAVRKLSWSELTSKPITGKSYKIGDIFYASDKTTPLGIVYQTTDNGVHGKVLSVRESDAMVWSSSGEWSNGIGAAWVIPTQKEWQDISVLKTMLNTVLKGKGLASISPETSYWSSTVDEEDAEKAISVTMPIEDNTDVFKAVSTLKTETAFVRAIMEF